MTRTQPRPSCSTLSRLAACIALPATLAALLILAAGTPPAAASPLSLYQQRAAYRQALADLQAGRLAAFREARAALADYTLAPYLDYYDLRRRLDSVSADEMHAFESVHAGLPASAILYFRWLRILGERHDWQALLDNYRASDDAELACYRRRGLLATGQREAALSGVDSLWTVATSQPEACDPLFDVWIDAGLLTDEMAWQRLQLALDAGQTQLARYLLRFVGGPLQPWGQALYAVHLDPARVSRRGAFREDNPYVRAVIGHGIERLADRDPVAAAAAWQRYQDSHAFDAGQTQAIAEYLLLAAARHGEFPERRRDGYSAELVSAMADLSLRAERWQQLLYWIDHMPADEGADLRWQYWRARALTRTQLGSEQARETYQALATQRNYYGFLAAEQIGAEVSLNPAQQRIDAARLADLRNRPPLQRALELYAVGDLLNARREWYAALPGLDTVEQYHAARLAQQEGWLALGIVTANDAALHDYLELRFPVAYPELFQRTSEDTTVPQPFLLAVARQESAFDPNARSQVNARGLMQLMSPTATQVARRIGAGRPSTADLYDPDINVNLGGHHLADLLNRYDQRRPLAAAAYNAGEHRVDRWVQDRKGQAMDVWIEDIPFRETRNYVKNVLAFTQVYARLLGQPAPMLEAHETSVN